MRRRTGAVGTLFAIAAIVPFAETAHAQDLNCRDFTYQEDAQAHYNADPRDPDRLDEDQGPDDGVACEGLPPRGGGGQGGDGGRGGNGDRGDISSTHRPKVPDTPVAPVAPVAPVTPVTPATTPATLAPTRGTRGGLGGSSTSGPSEWDIAVGLAFVTGAALTTGYVVRRRRS
ncbi:excalibur calcium-binding protein [Streptomyces sp. NPDC007808]|uniref:excalibur calcium-binding protein n=1 Tax=Streptomyces sp. NPDC007808 TaxID=3364779 RepID=UPI00368F172A